MYSGSNTRNIWHARNTIISVRSRFGVVTSPAVK